MRVSKLKGEEFEIAKHQERYEAVEALRSIDNRFLKNDYQRLDFAFEMLRRKFFFARHNYLCCQNCALHEINELYLPPRYVYYHAQDNDAFDPDDPGYLIDSLYLSFGYTKRDGNTIVHELKKVGFKVVWDGSTDHRILVIPSREGARKQ